MSDARIHQTPDSAEYFFDEGCHILEWLNSPEDPALSIARARVAVGATTRWHRLSGITERYLLLQGEGRVEVEGLLPTVVSVGAVVTIPPGAAQRISNVGAGDLVFLALCTPRFERAAYADAEAEFG